MIVHVKNEQELLAEINRWIRPWLKLHPDAGGAYQAYYWKDDPEKRIYVDIETSDGGASVFDYELMQMFASVHNNEFITTNEFTQCTV